MTQEQIIEHIFKSKKSDYELRTDSLYKYLNTFKLFGLNVVKNNGKFVLEKAPLGISFSEKELNTMNFLYSFVREICHDEYVLEFEKLLKNLIKKSENSDFKLELVDISHYLKKLKIKINKQNFQKFNSFCKDNQRLSFKCFNKVLNQFQTFIVEPIEVLCIPTGEVLRAYNVEIAEVQNFRISDIIDVVQLPLKVKAVQVKNSVTFALKGRLALTYELKKGERVIKSEKDYLVISNSEQDKNELLRRLLRYGVFCEILYPKTFRNKYVKTLKEIVELYN